MGREWYLNWGTKSSNKKGKTTGGGNGGDNVRSGGRNGGGSRGGEKKPTMQPPPVTTVAAAAATAGGCMNAVLHLFDFQHFQLCLHPQDSSFLPDDPTPLKGLEAPRNSLESITGEDKDDHLHILKGIQIKTNRRDTALKLVQAPRTKIEDMSSESSCSPAGARTPNLVARLMGLDILPESNNTTPRSSHSQTSPHIRTSTLPITTKTSKTTTNTPRARTSYQTDIPGSRSSPETPRSTRPRRSTDVVMDHHRLSLQINKENSIVKEMELARPSCSAISTKRKDGRNFDDEVAKSPSYYARQIMKQVKETVSRRVGVDITNTINGGKDQRRDEHLLSSTTTITTTKPKKSKKEQTHNLSSPLKSDQLAAAAAAVVTDINSKTVIEEMKHFGSENESLVKKFVTTTSSKSSLVSKKPEKSYYNSIRNKKEEQFVRPSSMNKKCKKTMLSSDLIHGTVPSSLVPLKKDFCSVTPAKLLDKQGIPSNGVQPSNPVIGNTSKSTSTSMTTTTTTTTRLSRYPRQRIDEIRKEEAMHAPAVRWRSKTDTTSTSIMEFQYISRILKCTGIDRDTPVSFMRWYLPSHPLDPSIYHSLEATHYFKTTDDIHNSSEQLLNLAINRKLIFHLVDEMLADMLTPYVKLKHHYHHHHHHHRRRHYHHGYNQNQQINGFQLVKILCMKIRSFPSSDCQTLQDIDALVEKDMPRFGAESNIIANHEEGEEIVSEIERVIMDSLIQEICCLN